MPVLLYIYFGKFKLLWSKGWVTLFSLDTAKQ